MPSSSSSLTSVASLNRGGGSVKCWSGRILSRRRVCPSATCGSARPSPSSSFSSSSRSAIDAGILIDTEVAVEFLDGAGSPKGVVAGRMSMVVLIEDRRKHL